MANQDILEKAIQKAIDNGFDGTPYWTLDFTAQGAAKAICKYSNPPYEQITFNHDFAKALWGTQQVSQRVLGIEAKGMTLANYLYHLQQMVIAEDPIKYLGDHLDD